MGAGVICWDRTDQLVIGTFLPTQIHWLRTQLVGVRDLIDRRTRQYSVQDPLALALGMPLPHEPSSSAVLNAVLRAYLPDDQPLAVRLWWEPDLLRHLRMCVHVTLATLPRRGGVVVLTGENAAHAWFTALRDLRIAYAVRTGTEDALVAPVAPDARSRPDTPYVLVSWLDHVVTKLDETVGLTSVR